MSQKQSNNLIEPLVSIGLFVRNGASCIHEVLDSLIGQTYKHFELIISDNASTDDTQAICEAYAKKDPRVRYIRQKEDIGRLQNADFVRHEARGEYYMLACHDDLYDKRYIEKCLEKFKEDPSAIGVFSRYRVENFAGTRDIDPSRSYASQKGLYERLKAFTQFHSADGKLDTIFSLWKAEVLTDIADESTQYSDLNWLFKQLFLGRLLQVDEALFTRREISRPEGYGYEYVRKLPRAKRFKRFFTDRIIAAMGNYSRLHASYILNSPALTGVEKTKLLFWELLSYLRGIWTGHY
ncbi:MAG: glycosyltransferase family 2 protein [bacterium]|nr:glycosyltransferase family 2 protein [bacterium]